MLIQADENYRIRCLPGSEKFSDSEDSEKESCCTVEFGLKITLEQGEVFNARAVHFPKLRLGYQHFRDKIPFSGKQHWIPGSNVKIKVFYRNQEVPENGVLLQEQLNKLKLQLSFFGDSCQSAQEANKLTGILNIELSNGTSLRNHFSVVYQQGGKKPKIAPPPLSVARWLAGYIALVVTISMVYFWAKGHEGAVYNAMKIEVVWIISVCVGTFVYLGLPRPESVPAFFSSLRKLHGMLRYPEFYFDQYLVKILRHWIGILVMLMVGFLVYTVSSHYEALSLEEIELLGTHYELGAKNNASALKGETNSMWLRTTAYVLGYADKFLPERNKKQQTPTKIYRRDVDGTTCVYFKLPKELSDSRVPRYCVAELEISDEKVTAEEISYTIKEEGQEEKKEFYPTLISPTLSKDGSVNVDHQTRAYIVQEVLRGNPDYIAEYEVTKRGNILAAELITPDIKPYITFLKNKIDRAENAGNLIPYNLKKTLEEKISFSSIVSEINKNRTVITGPYKNDFHSTFSIADVFSKLTFFIDESLKRERPGNIDLLDDILTKIPRIYAVSYLGRDGRDIFKIPYLKIKAGLDHFKSQKDIQNLTPKEKAALREKIQAMLNEHFKPISDEKVSCKELRFGGESLCNNTHDVFSDVMLFLLLLEKDYFEPGSLHSLIIKHLVRQNYPNDNLSYVVAASALGLINKDRQQYFLDFYQKTGASSYGCMYENIVAWQDSTDTNQGGLFFNNRIDKNFGKCDPSKSRH